MMASLYSLHGGEPCEVIKPTARLRWMAGRLQQEYEVGSIQPLYGYQAERIEWRDVIGSNPVIAFGQALDDEALRYGMLRRERESDDGLRARLLVFIDSRRAPRDREWAR